MSIVCCRVPLASHCLFCAVNPQSTLKPLQGRNVANVMQEPITEHNVEVMVIGKDNVEFLTEEQISGFVQSL